MSEPAGRGTPPDCEVEGCEHRSHFFLAAGQLCTEHAHEREPETVEYILAVRGIPFAAKQDPTVDTETVSEDAADPEVTGGD